MILEETIDSWKNSLIDTTCQLIRIPSVHSEVAEPNAPFGKEIAKALEFTLSLGKHLGFRTKNCNGYCGYIEFGKGGELLGIIGHLDVVPADNTWSYSPFEATISHGKLYGRGSIDNKGPVMAALYAMKAVMDSTPVSKRVRLILGTNEERDWKCMDYYKSQEEIPSIGFSPDADFPCIYAEKALLTVHLYQKYHLPESTPITIQTINDYHNAINVVPKQCDVTLQLSPQISMEDFLFELRKVIHTFSYTMETIPLENQQLLLKSYGVAAHAAHPDLGSNAISHVLLVLHHMFQTYHISLELLDFFASRIGDDYTGKHLKINVCDESGALTFNTARTKLSRWSILFTL